MVVPLAKPTVSELNPAGEGVPVSLMRLTVLNEPHQQ